VVLAYANAHARLGGEQDVKFHGTGDVDGAGSPGGESTHSSVSIADDSSNGNRMNNKGSDINAGFDMMQELIEAMSWQPNERIKGLALEICRYPCESKVCDDSFSVECRQTIGTNLRDNRQMNRWKL